MKKILALITLLLSLSFSRAQNTWTTKAPFGGSARNYAVGFSIGSKGYIGTGYDGSDNQKDFWEYDPSTNVWAQKADLTGGARQSAVGFSIGKKGYIGTGTYYSDFWEYDPKKNTWSRKADFGGGSRSQAIGFSINDKGYIGTGEDINHVYKKDFWEYDPATDVWTKKANFGGTARFGAVGFSIGNNGFIGTGWDLPHNNRNDFWEYDPSSDTWTRKADVGGYARSDAFGFSVGGKGYIGAGDTDNGFDYDFWEYDPASNTWIEKTGITGRYGAVGFSIKNKGYAGTGKIGPTFLKDFSEYTPDKSASITTGSVLGSPFCPEEAINVSFTSTGNFKSDNIYSAQLSDKNGSFNNPTSIGSLSSNANSGVIAATIPAKPKAGTAYRIRVSSSDPIVNGIDNGTDLELISCDSVINLTASGITSSSATIKWTGASCAANYKIQYRVNGTTQWTTRYSSVNSYLITNLSASTTYEYRVQTFCTASGSSTSTFTSTETFTTKSFRLASIPDEEKVKIYPNPARDKIIINFAPQSTPLTVELTNTMNEIIYNIGPITFDSFSIDVSNLPEGIYLMKIISGDFMETHKIEVTK